MLTNTTFDFNTVLINIMLS